MADANEGSLRRRIRLLLIFFMFGLVVSGLTAFPLQSELRILSNVLGVDPAVSPDTYSGLKHWISLVALGLRETNARFPFLAYGTDWLAFGHLAIAVFFIGPLLDPVRNVWVIRAGLIACAGVIPLALIAGTFRGIPIYWRLLDCSFGVLGAVPLWFAARYTRELARLSRRNARSPEMPR